MRDLIGCGHRMRSLRTSPCTVAALLLALCVATALPHAAAASDVTFTLKNCSQDRIDVRVYDTVDQSRMFPASGWSGMTYQQVIGFKCTRRKPTDPDQCTVVVVMTDSGLRQDHSVTNGNAVAFCRIEATRTYFDPSCSC